MVKEKLDLEFLSSKTLGQINRLLPDDNTLKSISNFYQIFSDSTRLRIISALSINEMCVSDLACLLMAHQSTISHQLGILRSNGIVDFHRNGKMILYYISNLLIDEVMSLGIENMQNRVTSIY